MTSLSLGARMLAASVVLAALVAAIFAILILAIVTLDDAREREAHSKEVTAATVVVEKLVSDLETGLRGYVFSGNRRFLPPWTRARAELPRAIRELKGLVARSPPQRRRARELETLINTYKDDFALPLVNIAVENPAAARGAVADAEGNRQTTAIRAKFEELLEAEDGRAEASAEAARTQSRRAVALGVAGLVGCALLTVLFGLYLARSTAQPVREVANAATRLADGDLSFRLAEHGPGEVGALTRAFNQMAGRLERGRRELESQNERLRESERRKTELVRIVSHELRTPLASILGFASILRSREHSTEDRQRYLEIIETEGRRLSALLNDFLDAERLEHGHLELERTLFDMSGVVEEQVRLYQGQSDKHRLDVVVPPKPLRVHGDPNRIAQVLGNLLSNAIKYSPDGGTVHVVAERQDGVVKVSVRDEGLGIPEDLQESVFAKFFRGEATASGIPGTGLGLTIARSVVEAHGGRLDFESGNGKGSVFWMELPVAASG